MSGAMKSVLFIRGGALGDFIVTLPALKLVREKWPEAHIELLGYPRHAILGMKRYYLDAMRSVDTGPLAGFFIPNGILDPGLSDYFGDFDLVVSYFYDPDKIFENNLKRCHVPELLTWPPQAIAAPAARYFCEPLKAVGLETDDFVSRLYFTDEDRAFAEKFLADLPSDRPTVAIHPGSGGERKNWPMERWVELCQQRVRAGRENFVVVAGESDDERLMRLLSMWPGPAPLVARQLPLPQLGAVLARCNRFIGHDSGVTHLAAAAGCPGIALFGPTDPVMWAPPGGRMKVIRKGESLSAISVEDVLAEMDSTC